MLKILFTILKKELLIYSKTPNDWLKPIGFLLLITLLFPLGIGPHPEKLASVATGLIWIGALLAQQLTITQLFYTDYKDGNLEQLMTLNIPLSLILFIKTIAHWLFTGLLISIISLVTMQWLTIDFSCHFTLLITLIFGTLTITLIGSIGAALTLNIKHSGFLLHLLMLPFYVPILIFATSAVEACKVQSSPSAQLLYLTALLLLMLPIAPLFSAAAIRMSLS